VKFFIDTANVEEIREAASLGVLDGVTTNPSLIAREGRDFFSVLREIVSIVDGPISAETTATDRDGMVEEGRELAKLHPNIVIKVPLIKEGLQACKILRGDDIGVNVTLCFSPSQALLAAKVDATFHRPAGRHLTRWYGPYSADPGDLRQLRFRYPDPGCLHPPSPACRGSRPGGG